MKITDYLRAENIFLDVDLPDKTAVLKFIARACAGNGIVQDESAVFEGLVEREQTMSTGVGGGLAFPHTTSEEAGDAAVILLRLNRAIDFEALDKKPVDIVLALIIPKKNTEMHVRLLARISRLCRDPDFVKAVRSGADPPVLRREMHHVEQRTAF